MSRREPELTLRQIVEFADEVAALVTTRAREDLVTNREFRRALERCVELIGEAATRLPEESSDEADRRKEQEAYSMTWRACSRSDSSF